MFQVRVFGNCARLDKVLFSWFFALTLNLSRKSQVAQKHHVALRFLTLHSAPKIHIGNAEFSGAAGKSLRFFSGAGGAGGDLSGAEGARGAGSLVPSRPTANVIFIYPRGQLRTTAEGTTNYKR